MVLSGLTAACADYSDPPTELAGADAGHGLELIRRAGCASCHAIPGIYWPNGKVGGSLAGFADRALISGRTPNRPGALVAFLENAPALQPGIAMPAYDLADEDLRDIAAYLYTLKHD